MEKIAAKAIRQCRKPGFLIGPLGWVYDRLSQAIAAEPTLVEQLFNLDAGRMHLMALALAHMSGDVIPSVALGLLEKSRGSVLNISVGHRPTGIDRALQHLPPKVLPAECYRNLVALLNDPATAKFLHHTGLITEPIITGLHNLPPTLRTAAIMGMFGRIDGMTRFVDGLRILAARAGLEFEMLADHIGALDQPNQVAAHIRQVVDSLPLSCTLPPIEIGKFKRLDAVIEIRDLAKNWKNCLADYVSGVNCATTAVYLSEPLQAVCLLCRNGRMGWLLVQTKGPENVEVNPDQITEIHAAFAAAGIPLASTVEAIRDIIQKHEWSRPGQAADQEEYFDDIALY